MNKRRIVLIIAIVIVYSMPFILAIITPRTSGEASYNLSEAELKAFNAGYLNYIGKQRGSTVRSLIQNVISNNQASPELYISVVFMGNEYTNNEDIKGVISKIRPTSSYEIGVKYTNEGRVNKIIIEEAKE